MYIGFVLLILAYFNNVIDSRDIEVMNSGLMKFNNEDMMIVFFVTIHHHGEKARNVMATMVECCEKVTDDDVDCELIHLYGEHLGVLQPGTTCNLTFLFPNLYGFNRRGSCVVDIWNRGEESNSDDSTEIRHRIDFDTSLRMSSQTPYLHGSFSTEKITLCETTDLDPFDGCNPVDCRVKYSGLRNYFNHKRKRCQKVPTCLADPNKELPDVAYVPMSNTCRNLEKIGTPEDLRDILLNKYNSVEDLEAQMVNIQCHHGEIDVRTGLCICDKGWTSEVFDPDLYNEGTSVYHMCDKKCHPDAPTHFPVVAFVIGICLALWICFLVILSESCNYFNNFYGIGGMDEEDEVCYYHVGGHNHCQG